MSCLTFFIEMKTQQNPTTIARHRYLWTLGLWMAVYIGLMFSCHWLWHQVTTTGWRVPIVLMPILPVVFIFIAIIRYVQAMDEFERKIAVNSLALSGGATALLSVTYGLLEGSMLPRPSAWWTYTVFMLGWIIASRFVSRRHQ